MKVNRINLAVLAVIVSACLPMVVVRSSPSERIFLKKPIFGSLLFASDLTIDSLMGGKYRTVDHPYIYTNSGESVKCLEPESGRLARTVPFDSNTEEPYSAVNTGICFIKTDQNGATFLELKRYDGTQVSFPWADRKFLGCWEPKLIIFRYDPDKSNGTETITALDENEQTLWKVDGIYTKFTDSSNRHWFRTKDGWFLVDPLTGKALVTIPEDFGFVSARGSLAFLLHESKVGVSGIFNIDTGKLVHECKDSHHTMGKDGFLCYQRQTVSESKDCFEFKKYNQDGQFLDGFKVNLPHEFSYPNSMIIDFRNNFMSVSIPQDVTSKIDIVNIKDNLTAFSFTGAIDIRFLDDDKLFFLSERSIGAIDANNFQQIWSMPIGNSYLGDDVSEKDFGNYKLVGRRVNSTSNIYGISTQVKIVDKTDGFVEPYEFEFENGGLRNCYETDYGFININALTQFSIYRPQISFYRRGSVKVVGIIDYIGKFVEKTIAIKDGRYLTANLEDGKSVSVDCRLMTFQINERPTTSTPPSSR
ncbi:MAG: hypothetical protein KA140_07845 [Caldisericia bacterium]|nr:hypothetical protein [Caldisericia bacterium]